VIRVLWCDRFRVDEGLAVGCDERAVIYQLTVLFTVTLRSLEICNSADTINVELCNWLHSEILVLMVATSSFKLPSTVTRKQDAPHYEFQK